MEKHNNAKNHEITINIILMSSQFVIFECAQNTFYHDDDTT